MLLRNNSDPFFNLVVTRDEKRILVQQHPTQWIAIMTNVTELFPKTKKFHRGKIMLSANQRVIHCNSLNSAAIITATKRRTMEEIP